MYITGQFTANTAAVLSEKLNITANLGHDSCVGNIQDVIISVNCYVSADIVLESCLVQLCSHKESMR